MSQTIRQGLIRSWGRWGNNACRLLARGAGSQGRCWGDIGLRVCGQRVRRAGGTRITGPGEMARVVMMGVGSV